MPGSADGYELVNGVPWLLSEEYWRPNRAIPLAAEGRVMALALWERGMGCREAHGLVWTAIGGGWRSVSYEDRCAALMRVRELLR
jgi:hypothetical protein